MNIRCTKWPGNNWKQWKFLKCFWIDWDEIEFLHTTNSATPLGHWCVRVLLMKLVFHSTFIRATEPLVQSTQVQMPHTCDSKKYVFIYWTILSTMRKLENLKETWRAYPFHNLPLGTLLYVYIFRLKSIITIRRTILYIPNFQSDTVVDVGSSNKPDQRHLVEHKGHKH